MPDREKEEGSILTKGGKNMPKGLFRPAGTTQSRDPSGLHIALCWVEKKASTLALWGPRSLHSGKVQAADSLQRQPEKSRWAPKCLCLCGYRQHSLSNKPAEQCQDLGTRTPIKIALFLVSWWNLPMKCLLTIHFKGNALCIRLFPI